ncbi:MAG: hypothetical protein K9G49_13540 [Taibaiella sp.]|nr:hypothetical protein [Taibaiella sp.]
MEKNELLLEKLSKDIEAQRSALSHVIGLIINLSNAVNDGFAEVNQRLAILEGKQGMQGVNTQLTDIKTELGKIQKAYPYEELFANMQSISKGDA